MPSNVTLNTGSGGPNATTKQRTHDGDTTQQQVVSLAAAAGTEDAYTHTDIQAGTGTGAASLRVNLATDVPLPAGSNNIGTVSLDAAALSALETITVASVTAPLAAGTNNIGDVDVLTLPSIPAGTNNIGDVDIVTMPNVTLNAETTKVIGTVNIAAAQTIAAVTAITNALPAGSNVIGALSANQTVNVAQINGVTPLMGNGASGTGAQRVTLANDSTGVLASVGSITGSVVPGTGATNLGKAEDAVHASGDTGVMMLGVRQDADTSPVSASGDYQTMMFDANGYLKVNIKAGAGSGGTALADNAAFTRGTTSVTPFAGVVEASAPTLTAGNVGCASFTTSGGLRVSLTSGGILGVVEDAAAAGGEEGLLSMTVRQDTIGSTTSADGDFQNLKTNSVGALYQALSHLGANAVATGNGTSSTGTLRVVVASDNTAFTVNAQPLAATSGGVTPISYVSAASNNATTVKASAGQVYSITVTSVNAAMRYLKLYNKASNPAPASDTPLYVVPIPGNTAGAGATITFPVGLVFSTGIAFAVVAGASATDNTSVGSGDHVISFGYK